MDKIEYNDDYESLYFNINIPVTVYGRLFKMGQQFKWRYRKWQKANCDCANKGHWIYVVDCQVNDCPLERGFPISEENGAVDRIKREWFELSPMEQGRNVGRDVFHQPHEKEKGIWHDKNGYLKRDV